MEKSLANCSPRQYRRIDGLCNECLEMCSKLNELTADQRKTCSQFCATTTMIANSTLTAIQMTTSATAPPSGPNYLWLLVLLLIPIVYLAIILCGHVLWRTGWIHSFNRRRGRHPTRGEASGNESEKLLDKNGSAGNHNDHIPAAGNHNDHIPAAGNHNDHIPAADNQNGHIPAAGNHNDHTPAGTSSIVLSKNLEGYQNVTYSRNTDDDDSDEKNTHRHSESENVEEVPLLSNFKSSDLSCQNVERGDTHRHSESENVEVMSDVLKDKSMSKGLQCDGQTGQEPLIIDPDRSRKPSEGSDVVESELDISNACNTAEVEESDRPLHCTKEDDRIEYCKPEDGFLIGNIPEDGKPKDAEHEDANLGGGHPKGDRPDDGHPGGHNQEDIQSDVVIVEDGGDYAESNVLSPEHETNEV